MNRKTARAAISKCLRNPRCIQAPPCSCPTPRATPSVLRTRVKVVKVPVAQKRQARVPINQKVPVQRHVRQAKAARMPAKASRIALPRVSPVPRPRAVSIDAEIEQLPSGEYERAVGPTKVHTAREIEELAPGITELMDEPAELGPAPEVSITPAAKSAIQEVAAKRGRPDVFAEAVRNDLEPKLREAGLRRPNEEDETLWAYTLGLGLAAEEQAKGAKHVSEAEA